MPKPVLLDTDMGVDDAVAAALALSSPKLSVNGIVAVGGNVPLDQAARNIVRLLAGMAVENWPAVGRGLEPAAASPGGAAHVHGSDGFGEIMLPVPAGFVPEDYREVYTRLIGQHGGSLTIVAVGPLTNLAAIHREYPGLLARAGQIVIMGGAVWCSGNVTPHAEFNFHQDPVAAAEILGAGLPVTLVPLDVTSQVAIDESHAAHLSRSGTRAGELLARMIRWPMERAADGRQGRFLVHDALAVGVLLWPDLFLRSRLAIAVEVQGPQAGRSRPVIGKGSAHKVAVVISVNVPAFLENMLETLCQERFVV